MIEINNTQIVMALVGGALIGLSSWLMLLFFGKIAGISGILGGLMKGPKRDKTWRLVFLLGLIQGGAISARIIPEHTARALQTPLVLTILGGLLVGLGTQVANGCTSGHGICGISRFSKRSIVATMIFMAAAIVTVFVKRLVS